MTRLALCSILSLLLGSTSTARADPTLYVSCEDEGAIAALTLRRGVAGLGLEARTRLDVGKRPRGLRLSHDGRALYVALSGTPKRGPKDEGAAAAPDRAADGIGVVDLAARRLVRVLESGADPESFDLSPDGATIYVSNEDAARASVVRVGDGHVARSIPVGGEPEGVAVRPDGKVVYVTSEADGVVGVLDPARGATLRKLTVPARPRGVIFDPAGRRAYVTSENGAAVSVIDARRHALLATIAISNEGVKGPLGARPMGLALTRDGRTLYVSNGRGGTVSVIETAAQKVVRTIADVGARPWGIALSPEEDVLFTANGPSNDVSIVELRTGTVRRVPVCGGPWGLALAR